MIDTTHKNNNPINTKDAAVTGNMTSTGTDVSSLDAVVDEANIGIVTAPEGVSSVSGVNDDGQTHVATSHEEYPPSTDPSNVFMAEIEYCLPYSGRQVSGLCI